MNAHTTASVPPTLQSLIELEMQSGERVVWMDQPIPSRLAHSTWPIVVFGMPWTIFAVFWMVGASWGTSQMQGPSGFKFFSLFGLPFVLIGVAMLSSPFWVRRSAQRSAYVLTDRRAILFRANWRGAVNVRSFNPDQLTNIQRVQERDGSGDVIFAQDIPRDNDGNRVSRNVGFLAIREVKAVEDLVRVLAQSKRS